MEKIGEVTHFYDNISVAVIALNEDLSVGDTVQFSRNGEELFEQQVESMEIDEQPVDAAMAGDEVAIKVEDEVKEGTDVSR